MAWGARRGTCCRGVPTAQHFLGLSGDRLREPLDEASVMAPEVGEDLVALDAALEQLAARDAEAAELVKLRFFAGLTSAQAADALGISPRTADRAWTYARVFLLAELKKSQD